jgi:ribosomal protein L35
MPKQKTRKIVLKRFKINKNGKIKRKAGNNSHLKRKADNSTRQRKSNMMDVEGKYNIKIKKMIGR